MKIRNITVTFIVFLTTINLFAQVSENDKLIEMSKIYNNFMFMSKPTKDVISDLQSNVPEKLKQTSLFITQTITSKNQLLTPQFLTRPDNTSLKQIYIIRELDHNYREEEQIENKLLIDSLTVLEVSEYELLDCYYGMLFTAVGNKNQPFDLSKIDVKIKDYKLKDDTEKGILFLRCMDFCRSDIWGYMNIPDPANTKKAYADIKKFPKINGMAYFHYKDFSFTDFQMEVVEDKGIQGYKNYYINQYFETLLYHFACLLIEVKDEEKINELLLGSILREKNLYKYTVYKESLEELIQEIDSN